MKTKKYTFNQLLFKYNKYRAKLDRFRLTNRNTHRQGVLEKHIERLREKLYSLYASIKTVGKVATLATALAIAIPNTADAQIQFAPVVVNPFGLIHLGASSNSELVDLDGDGDLDMMSGEYSGFFYYFENAAGAGNTPVFFAGAQTNPFSLTNIGLLSNSELVDLDGDGDLDMMAGASNGVFNYFENTAGAGNTPVFAAVQINPFSLTDIGYGYGSNSGLVDLDGDGDLDMMAGTSNGNFYYFENITPVSTLPVELLSFSAEPTQAETVALLWKTATEIANDGFEILHSTDAENWRSIGFVKGNGNTNEANTYDFMHKNPASKLNYYKLKQIDFDGQYEYSDIVRVNIKSGLMNTEIIAVYPNPLEDELNIDFEGEINIEVVNITGEVLIKSQEKMINVKTLSSGIYFLRIYSENNELLSTQKVIKN